MENCYFACCCNSCALYFEIEEHGRQKRREINYNLRIKDILRPQLHYTGLLSERCIPRAERSDFHNGYRSAVYQM